MVLEVGLVHHIVDESCHVLHSCCIGCRIRTVEREVEVEIRELLLDCREVFEVECLHESPRSIEEVNFLLGLQGLEKLHNVAAERCHTCTATHEDILLRIRIVLRKKELSERTADNHLVTRLACEHIG